MGMNSAPKPNPTIAHFTGGAIFFDMNSSLKIAGIWEPPGRLQEPCRMSDGRRKINPRHGKNRVGLPSKLDGRARFPLSLFVAACKARQELRPPRLCASVSPA